MLKVTIKTNNRHPQLSCCCCAIYQLSLVEHMAPANSQNGSNRQKMNSFLMKDTWKIDTSMYPVSGLLSETCRNRSTVLTLVIVPSLSLDPELPSPLLLRCDDFLIHHHGHQRPLLPSIGRNRPDLYPHRRDAILSKIPTFI